MNIKRVLAVAVVGGVAMLGFPGTAMASTVEQDFSVISINSAPGLVVATGSLIYGAGVEQNTRALVPPGSPFQVTFTFAEGQLVHTVVPGPPQIDVDPVTCVTRIVSHPTTVVTGGTGVFAGATGTGTATTRRTVVAGLDATGACLPPTAPPILALGIIESTMTLTLL